jgi:Glycosyltransferases involved in cell wall biogenesis
MIGAAIKSFGDMNAPVTLMRVDAKGEKSMPSCEGTRISIIVPVWNEAPLICPFLEHVRERAPETEIIVADGGSSDGTAELAEKFADRIVRTRRNRAVQMNAGARVASGDVLWFLHVDVELPPQCSDEIGRTLNDPNVAGGYFRIRLPQSPFVYRLTDSFAHYAGILLRMRCGDHGIFCRRQLFEDLGGFPETPIMEDVEFFRMLHRRGRVACMRKRIVANPRRYEQIGHVRLTLAYGLIATLYALGVSLPVLMWLYTRTCCSVRTADVTDELTVPSRNK